MARDLTILISEIPHLRRFAFALTADRDFAEDLVQSCLENAVARFHQWQPERRLRPWLFAILHNLYRDSRRRPQRGVPLDEVPEIPSSDASPEERMSAGEVLAAIDLLPEDQRDVLVLVGLNELSYAEAASVLGIPPGTLMSRLHRARSRLREMLGRTKSPSIRQVL
ncbi:RNA polymerase sigma factor [Albidovulum sediminicola]|uniref:RNA polymerase sigma factor n=1 Tax=Albidovulum sediminicola TaxID=2984331 RepID=A0ABT2Z5Q8_9RHOB|nr:RNA polymerase sigma factor [Defluviimonas sp. WL0075]MCV2866405.1 RNA polymerase sigma factor [Defluviimonas sp. WL0075]